MLTTGETLNFLDAGGIANFIFGKTLHIDINAGAANRAHLKIRSTLESMTRHVTNIARIYEFGKLRP